MIKSGSIFIAFVCLVTTSVYSNESPNKGKEMKFGMHAVLTATPGSGNDLAALMLAASRAVAELKGCELYIVQQSLTDESKVLITEVWESKEAHQSSLSNEKIRALISKAKPMIAGMEHNPAKLIGGHGL